MKYIDSVTELPQNLGEIYSDRNIRVVGQARINPASPTQIDTIGLQVICSPLAGGNEGISTVADGTKTLGGVGSSMWVKITRSGTSSAVPEFYAAGSQPKPREDYVQVFYHHTLGMVITHGSFVIEGPYYIRFGYGIGQRVYDAIVGTAGDIITHTDLQTAINDVAAAVSSSGGWILVKKMCAVTTTITTPSGKPIKLYFQGYGTGLQASGSPGTGIQFGEIGCQLVGFGQITGFTTAVNLNNKAGCRLEMVFSGNGTNINFGTLLSDQVNFQGSYGLTENSHIETAATAGILGRWNNTKKRWEPISSIGGKTTITVDDTGQTQIAVAGGLTTTVDTTGKVGIGKLPSYALDVLGSVFATGAVNGLKTSRSTAAGVTLAATDCIVYVTSAGTITLPTSSAGRTYIIKSLVAGTVTVSPASGTIDGAASFPLTLQYQGVMVGTDGTNWYTLALTRISYYE